MKCLEQLLGVAELRHPCDLDLLLFFDRHPAALMTSEQLAAFVGYDVAQVGTSLDFLVERQLVVLSPNPTHRARMYRFKADHRGEVRELLMVAAAVDTRRRMRRVLGQGQARENTALPSAGNGVAKPASSHA